ncbi:hypothetical protein HALLA_10915 [Halostagnicola larsenii XH-48]|uniref:Uncharacterized protein n=1 Tax=Halostagnicola larsenii XH-48 TaxID=797299 RepID=W0JL50_9EURY|nr:hypothetical protein [Halostagnicola larsenii]AHF99293.1 hypothetical protein HALLA_10915 [Halostagnicola larsenii XH-48]
MTDRDEDLAEAVRELSETIDELRAELEPRRRRSPLRPPTPRELLRVADEFAIPAALTVLKANVRALEAFQRGIKLVQTERDARDRTKTAAKSTEKRAKKLRKTTVSQLDTVLEELQRGVSEGSVPADERVAGLLAEARNLRDDVDRRLQEVAEQTEANEAQSIEIDGEDTESDGAGDVNVDAADESNVDVDAELETLKDQFTDDDDDDRPSEGDGDDSPGDGNGRGTDDDNNADDGNNADDAGH